MVLFGISLKHCGSVLGEYWDLCFGSPRKYQKSVAIVSK